MRFAYADPPYLGMGKMYASRHPRAMEWDNPETHRALITRLSDEWPDGWVLSLHTPSLRVLLPMCPNDARVGAWVKPFASFKPGVNPAYAWEPVIWRGGRKRGRDCATERDWLAENITLKKGFPGAKPARFGVWVLGLLGAEQGDTVDDLFPGSGGVGRAMSERLSGVPELFGLLRGDE